MSHVYASFQLLEEIQKDLLFLIRNPVNIKTNILHEKLEKYNISIEYINDAGKNKKKTKQEMIRDMEQKYERTKVNYDTQLSDLSIDFETREIQCLFPKIIFKTNERSIKTELLRTDDPKKYLLEKFSLNPKLYHFSSFIMLCKSYYVIDKNDQLLECFPYICTTANPSRILFIDIPYQISECLYCAPSFYGILGNELFLKKQQYNIDYEEDFDLNLIIHSLPLALHDKLIIQRFGDLNENKEYFSFEINYIECMNNYYFITYIHIKKNENNIEHQSKHKFILKPYFEKKDLFDLKEYLFSLEKNILHQPLLYMKKIYNNYKNKIYVKKNNILI